MVKNKVTFSVKVDEKDVELAVIKPSPRQLNEAQKVYNKAFKEAVESGAILRAKIEQVMRSQGLWDDDKEETLSGLRKKLRDGELALLSGKIKLSAAKSIALGMQRTRGEMDDLMRSRNELDNKCAEAQADNTQFNYLVSACTVYNTTNEPFFKGLEDYTGRAGESAALMAATKFAFLRYGLEENFADKYPENKFLRDYKFADAKNRLLDKAGKLVDEDGRHVDEDGRYIKWQEDGTSQWVDVHGNPVDKEGNYIVDFVPFVDDDGNPVAPVSA